MAGDLGEAGFRITAENDVASGTQAAVAEAKAAISEIDAMEANAEVHLKNKAFMAEIAKCEAELKKLATLKAETKADLDSKAFDAAAASLVAKKKMLERKIEIPVDLDQSAVSRGASALAGLDRRLQSSEGTLKKWFTSLGKVRVQMGFVSGTVRQMAIGVGALSPILFGLIGTASSLIGVMGTGLVGALTVGGAAVSGFGLTVAGLLPSLKQLFTEAKSAPSIVGPLRKMRDALTGGIRQDFFQGAHQMVTTLSSDFPVFQRNATAAFGAATDGWRKWMTGLRSPEAKNILQNILGGFTGAIPGLMQGLGTLGATMGRVFASAAKSLPSLSGGFAQWAQNLSKAVGSGHELDTGIGRLVTHMRDLGHLGQAAGSTIVTFFNAGANSGDSMVRSLTGVLDKWNAWMQSAGGRNSLADFFARSEKLARALFPAIARIGTALANVSVAFEPLTQAAASTLNGIAQAAAAIPPPVLQAFGALMVLNKAMKLLMIDKGFTMLTTGIKNLLPMVGALRAAFGVGGLTGVAEALGVSSRFLLGAGALGGAGAVFAGVTIGASILSNKMDEMDASTKAAIVSFEHQNTLVKQLPTTYDAYRASIHATKTAQDAYNQTLKQTGPHSHETAVATKELNAAIRQQNAELASLRSRGLASYNQGVGQAAQSTNNLNSYLNSTDPYLTQMAANFAAARGKTAQFDAAVARNGSSVRGLIQSLKAAGLSIKEVGIQNLPMLQNALQRYNGAQQGAAANVVNYARSLKNLAPVTGKAAAEVGKFIQQFGQVKGAKRAVISTNAPQQAAQIARLSTQLNRVGQKKAVIRILAEGGPANKTVDELQKKVDGVNRKKGVAKLEARDNTGGKIDQAKSKLDGFSKDYKATMHLLGAPAATAAAQQATSAVNAFPTGTRTMNLVTNYQTFGKPPGGYAGGAFGLGGNIPGFASGGDAQLANAHDTAANRQPLDGRKGARVNSPRYIVGEESQREYVIATNPQYRRANMTYLMAAAADLGAGLMLPPGYKKGGGPAAQAAKKKKKGGAPGDVGNADANLDNATGPGSAYDSAEKEVALQADKVSLMQRYMEAGTATVEQYQGAIGTEIADYQALAGIIGGLVTPAFVKQVAVPKVSKVNPKAKGAAKKRQVKAQKASQDAHDKAQAHNDAASGQFDLSDELRHINEVIIPGLQLDQSQAASQAQQLAFQNLETAGTLRQQVFNQYASNLASGGGQFPAVGPLGLATSQQASTIQPSGSVSGTGSATMTPAAAQSAGTGATGVTINQTFAAPPPDPHTYAQGVAFEIGAAVV